MQVSANTTSKNQGELHFVISLRTALSVAVVGCNEHADRSESGSTTRSRSAEIG